jgi:putative toxin-antitoxin system antitoxin component (TIGR02293 family)
MRGLRPTLPREQSDSAVRLARIEAIADDLFGSHDEARAWLRAPNGTLGGESPLTVLDTEEGGRLVEAMLGRIAQGIVE